VLLFILTENYLFDRHELIMLKRRVGPSIACSLYKSPSCHTLSNAFNISIKIAPARQWFSKRVFTCSVIRRRNCTVE